MDYMTASTTPAANDRQSDENPTSVSIGIAIGYAAIFAGGLVAAVTAPLGLEKGSWLAAYLVLVAGLAQLLLSNQAKLLGASPPHPKPVAVQLAAWLGGNAAVVIGSLLSAPLIADIGGVALIIALVFALRFTQRAPVTLWLWALRAFYFAVIISVPVGLVLSHVRA